MLVKHCFHLINMFIKIEETKTVTCLRMFKYFSMSFRGSEEGRLPFPLRDPTPPFPVPAFPAEFLFENIKMENCLI